jgi:hypothetical protein
MRLIREVGPSYLWGRALYTVEQRFVCDHEQSGRDELKPNHFGVEKLGPCFSNVRHDRRHIMATQL